MSGPGGQARSISDFYDTSDLSALPTATVADQPATTSDIWAASRVAASGDREDTQRQRLDRMYAPIVEKLNDGKWWFQKLYNPSIELDTDLAEKRVWYMINDARKTDPGFMLDVAGKDRDDLYAKALDRDKVAIAKAQETMSRSRGFWQGTVGFLGGAYEQGIAPVLAGDAPTTTAGLFAGGLGGRTVVGRILSEGAVNMGVTAALQPQIAANRAELGQTMTAGEMATNIGVAGLIGAGVQGTVEGIGSAFRARVPVASMTEAERGATDMAARDATIDAANPFGPGAGSDAHYARMQATLKAAELGAPVGSLPDMPVAATADVPSVNPAMAPREQVKSLIRSAESGGNDAAGATTSSAYGRYQFTKGTWKRLYLQRYGRGGLTDADIYAKRADGGTQETLVDDLLRENSNALARSGIRQTAGNLYLLHFAGQEDGIKLLSASRDAPIETVMRAGSIKANPALFGANAKNRITTVGELVDWADRKMGGSGGNAGPVLDRSSFATDDDWRTAQAQVDADEATRAVVARKNAAVDAPDTPDFAEMARNEARAGDNEAALTPWESSAPSTIDQPMLPDLAPAPRRGARSLPVRTQPSDVVEFLADRGGVADNEGHALARSGQGGRDMGQAFAYGSGRLVRKSGMSIDTAGELLHEAGYFADRPTTADVLDMLERAVNGREKIYPLADQANMVERARVRQLAEDTGYAERTAEGLGIDRQAEPELFDDVLARITDGSEPWDAFEQAVYARHDATLARAAQDGGKPYEYTIDYLPGFGDEQAHGVSRGPADESGAGLDAEPAHPGLGDTELALESASGREPAGLSAFDEAHQGNGAERTIESIRHDVDMRLEQEPDALFSPATDEAPARTIREVLDDIDGDKAAIEAARRCMVPGGGA
jgi:hypothetical protein